MHRGRKPDTLIIRAFDKVVDSNSKNAFGVCKACKWRRYWHATELRRHLENCEEFKQQEISKHLRTPKPNSYASSPQRLGPIARSFTAIPSSQRELICKRLTMAIIIDNLPLNLFNTGKELPNVLAQLINPHIKMPSNTMITKRYLEQCYQEVRADVNGIIQGQEMLNFIADETSNIRRERVLNICTHAPPFGAFYEQSDGLGTQRLDSKFIADWIITQMGRITKQEFSKINSVVTDTCNTQRAVGKIIANNQQTSHIFWVPCDSHSLQLLIKDILSSPWYSDVMKKAQSIVTSFTAAHKQLAVLRDIMLRRLGKVHSFVLSVITRWGTQVAMLKSVLSLKLVIQEYFERLPPDTPKDIAALNDTVTDPQFWGELDFVLELIKPINEAIKMSESDQSTVVHVVERWKGIEYAIHEHITGFNVDGNQLLLRQLKNFVYKRFETQTSSIHIAAHYINPQTVGDDEIGLGTSTSDCWQKTCLFLQQYLPSQNYVKAVSQLEQFRRQEGVFNPSSYLWQLKTDRIAFWDSASRHVPELGAIARRLVRTPATSVPSERAFSILNLMLNKLRNRLSNAKLDMLQYIYINKRILRRTSITSYSDEDLLALEKALISIGEDATTNPELNGGLYLPVASSEDNDDLIEHSGDDRI
jgi:Protein of unknown function (DUF 659)/hAT family C-terminal dimerisation region